MQREEPTARPRPPWWRVAVVGLVAAAAAGHLVVVTLAALPPNTYSEAARPATSYLGAYFAQNWRLFAPNPVSADRSVRFQGAYEQDGELVVTAWLDWTDVELDLVRHRLVGGRAGYVTNKLYGPLGSRYGPLDTDQRPLADVGDPEDARPWNELRAALLDVADDRLDERQVDLYLAYDRATTRLATEALEAVDPDREIVAVRYATRSRGVTPWEARGKEADARELARPAVRQRINGWREPLRGDETEQSSIRDFWVRHR